MLEIMYEMLKVMGTKLRFRVIGKEQHLMNFAATTRKQRFYLRGLPLLTLLLALLIFGVTMALGSVNQAQASNTSIDSHVREITVGYGDTLWSIAGTYGADKSRTDVIAKISELNRLDSSELEVGQTLYVPIYSAE